jgi:hypothetical protein
MFSGFVLVKQKRIHTSSSTPKFNNEEMMPVDTTQEKFHQYSTLTIYIPKNESYEYRPIILTVYKLTFSRAFLFKHSVRISRLSNNVSIHN